jgi:hypothetical protein
MFLPAAAAWLFATTYVGERQFCKFVDGVRAGCVLSKLVLPSIKAAANPAL